ncbi:hypothetical protein CGLO_13301 [Colletotrichum gloeosporioides Cg-14]|uniref:Uncharacterized protein n=1 Tax=Colletotrichum gloeosporioides (strain Cg-14) TaxID=1237896 RepID=T0K6D4_COLGC|nr:hypothetical protein CGLO_13301 [Colletotrichum gloeosporioides Cg-14]
MADVYENAFLTIATDEARDPTRGSLTPWHLEKISAQDATAAKPDKPGGKRNYDVLSVPIKDDTGAECIIHTLFCECNCIAREFHRLDGHNGPKVSYERAMARLRQEREDKSRREDSDRAIGLANRPRMLETIKTWTLIIDGYTGRDLTFVTDKLPAIAGLARRYATQVQGPSTLQPPDPPPDLSRRPVADRPSVAALLARVTTALRAAPGRVLRDHAASGAELAAFERIGLITSISRKYQKDEISALSWFRERRSKA